MKKLFLYILIIFVSISCQNKQEKPDQLIDKTTYKAVLKDIILANSVAKQLKKKDSTANKKLLGLVYKKYGIDSLQLKQSTDYYSQHPEILEEIYREIKEEFTQQKDSLEKKVSPAKKPKTDSIKLPKKVLKTNPLPKNKEN